MPPEDLSWLEPPGKVGNEQVTKLALQLDYVRTCMALTLHLCVKQVLGVGLAGPAPGCCCLAGEKELREVASPRRSPSSQALGYMAGRTELFPRGT